METKAKRIRNRQWKTPEYIMRKEGFENVTLTGIWKARGDIHPSLACVNGWKYSDCVR